MPDHRTRSPVPRRPSLVDQGGPVGFLDAFDDNDFADVDEVIVDIARDHPTLLLDKLAGARPVVLAASACGSPCRR